METGIRVRDKQGDEGVIIRNMSLSQVAKEEGSDPEPGDEDVPYLEVKRINGTKFFAFEGDCKHMRD